MTVRTHDLPPLWDDRRVTWGEWRVIETSARFHTALKDQACRKCGSLATRRSCTGVLSPLPDATERVWDRIYVSRCADCGHDQAWDDDSDQLWDLDDSDYGDQGSVDPEQVQGALF